MNVALNHITETHEIDRLREELYSLRNELQLCKTKKNINDLQLVTDEDDDDYKKTRYQVQINDLQKRNDELTQFSYIISHNVRAPIASILGLVDLINHTKKPEVVIKSTHMLLESALTLDNIIKDLNKIIHLKGADEERETIAFDDILSGTSYLLYNEINENKAFFRIDFSSCAAFKSIKGHIQSIFYNLISNSIKYRKTHIPPIISIKSAVEENQIILIFSDNGLGIDLKKFKSKIFAIYQRFHLHTEGKGMGLYLVKSHVEALGGKIDVSSEINEGTTFVIKFPLS